MFQKMLHFPIPKTIKILGKFSIVQNSGTSENNVILAEPVIQAGY